MFVYVILRYVSFFLISLLNIFYLILPLTLIKYVNYVIRVVIRIQWIGGFCVKFEFSDM